MFGRSKRKLKLIVCVLSLCVLLLLIASPFRLVSRYSKDQVALEIGFLNREQVHQENPSLVELVRNYWLIPPSAEPYNLEIPLRTSSDGQGQLKALETLLLKIKNGRFIECGAFDGEYLSNTLWLEKELGWTGLLLEADPLSFNKLVAKHRKAWISNTCISQYLYPTKWTFKRNPLYAVLTTFRELNAEDAVEAKSKMGELAQFDVQCIPLFTFMVALDQYIWDFFSLDTEGSELMILNTIPFERVLFKIITVESNLIPEGTGALDTFMTSKGYRHYIDVLFDRIYIHNTAWDDLVGTS